MDQPSILGKISNLEAFFLDEIQIFAEGLLELRQKVEGTAESQKTDQLHSTDNTEQSSQLQKQVTHHNRRGADKI